MHGRETTHSSSPKRSGAEQMQVTSIGEFRTAPGTYLEWPVSLGAAEASSIPPSFNQSFHLAAALGGSDTDEPVSTVWIATAFDVDGPIDIDALTWAFERFIERHAALRTTFHAAEDGIRRCVHPATGATVGAPSATVTTDSAELSAHIRSRMNHLCRPSRRPSYSFAAVDRPNSSTILCGFDHAHVDAVSMTVAADEISTLYLARLASEDIELPLVGSFVEYCDEESTTPEVPVSDPRIEAWSQFVAGCGGSTPGFPFALGVPDGQLAPQATTIHPIAPAASVESFERRCRGLGAGMFSAITAAMAEASAKIGGPQSLPLLFPLHTRRDAEYTGAVGWFTTNAPMSVTVGTSFAETLASAHSSFRAALPLGTVPIPRVLHALGETFVRRRHDVFMISYIDYRALPGAGAPDRNAHHISNVTTADDAQFWISRTDAGLSLRARFPDTEQARAVIERFTEALIAVIAAESGVAQDSSELSLVGPSA